MKKIFLTSCGIRNDDLIKSFYKSINKDIKHIKVLYITTAADGDPPMIIKHGWM